GWVVSILAALAGGALVQALAALFEQLPCAIGPPPVNGMLGWPCRLSGFGGGTGHVDTIHRAGFDAQFEAGTVGTDDSVHLFGGSDDGVGRTDLDAARTADTFVLANEGHTGQVHAAAFGVERLVRHAGQLGQPGGGLLAAGRAAIDVGLAGGNGLGIGAATVVTAAPALGLRQQGVNGIDGWPVHGYLILSPGLAPASGDSRWGNSPAAMIMPSETPKRILRGARLATSATSRFSSVAGS